MIPPLPQILSFKETAAAFRELVDDAIVAVGETLLRRYDQRRAPQHPLLGRFESDGPDAASTLVAREAEQEVDDGPALSWTQYFDPQ